MALRDYLGKSAATLLESPPYRSWQFERTVEEDLPDHPIDYVCEAEGISITCDGDDRIRTIFLTATHLAHAEIDLPPESERSDVLALFGQPSRSGAPSRQAQLGEYGAWDRYDATDHSLHIEYLPHMDRIKMVTLMRADAVPGRLPPKQ